jgi:y4mF family transcriptional regulator
MSKIKSIFPNPEPAKLLKAAARIGQTLLPKAKEHRAASIYDALKVVHQTNIYNPKDFGIFIQSVRKSKDLTQQELADLAGVGRRFIVECEAGKPRLEFAKVLQVAAAAGIDIFAIKR